METRIQKELDRAWQMHNSMQMLRAGTYETSDRHQIFATLIWVAESHHRAILVLVNDDTVGSALALWRPLLEACCRALFVGFIATDKEVEDITKDREPYPEFKCLARMVDQACSTGDRFTQYGNARWKPLNSFTHGGLLQLSSRMDKEGRIGDYFPVEFITDLIAESTGLLKDTEVLFLNGLQRNADADSVLAKYAALYPQISE